MSYQCGIHGSIYAFTCPSGKRIAEPHRAGSTRRWTLKRSMGWNRRVATTLVLCLLAFDPSLTLAAGAPTTKPAPNSSDTSTFRRVTTVTGSVNGARGGSVSNGIWALAIPAGAFSGTAEISISVPALNPYTCDLQITGAPNSFRVPVRLAANASARPEDPSALTIYWYNPQTATWVDQSAAGDASRRTVTASLSHFSTYKLSAKAGW